MGAADRLGGDWTTGSKVRDRSRGRMTDEPHREAPRRLSGRTGRGLRTETIRIVPTVSYSPLLLVGLHAMPGLTPIEVRKTLPALGICPQDCVRGKDVSPRM